MNKFIQFQLSLLMFLEFFIWGGWYVVSDALTMEQTTPALGWKMGHVYLALPIAGFFMFLFTLEGIFEMLNQPESALDEIETEEKPK